MELAISGRAVIIGLAIALLLSGVYAFSQLDIEAYPDPVQPMVELLTLPNGLSAEEVERLVTVPLEYTLSSTRNLESMRSISLFGLSDIRCYFSWESDYYWDHSETVNQLQFVGLPPGITAGISPENSIGEIYRYTVESPDHDLINEKTVNDWIVSRQLSTVPGVIGDSTFGGLTKQYHVDVDPQKLDYYHVPLSTLTGALANANISSGGNYLDVGEQAFHVRGLGFVQSLADIGNTALAVNKSPSESTLTAQHGPSSDKPKRA
jgi:heavy metal efflux system protein